MEVTKEQLESILKEAKKNLEASNTPKPYRLYLVKDFYNTVDKEWWINYKKTHPNVFVYFQDKKAIYELNDAGELFNTVVF